MNHEKITVSYELPPQVCRETEGGRIEQFRDAYPEIEAALGAFHVGDFEMENEGYIGIPVKLHVYTDPLALRIPEKRGTRIDAECEPNNYRYPGGKLTVFYVINTNTERVGTERDEVIIRDLLSRGFHVIVTDYLGEVRAKPPHIDWSMQAVRAAVHEGRAPLFGLPVTKWGFYILPAGYSIKIGLPFYNYAENGVDGVVDYIVDIWNNSLSRRVGRFAQGERHITYWGDKTDKEGNPLLDENGRPIPKRVRPDAVWEDEEKRLIKVCYTIADDITDCCKPTGEPLDMNLYLDLMYPVKPKHKVPAMALHSSSQDRNDNHMDPTRPTMTGFLFRGYAGVTYDHAYTPMARDDHMGYFEGEIKDGRRTDFTLRFATAMESLTSPIRLLRKLAELCPEYGLDGDAIGSYGHSKGAPTNILGTRHPECLPKEDYLRGYHGELSAPQQNTIYEDGSPIPSNIRLVYTSNGGGGAYLASDMAPTVVTQGELDGRFSSNSHYGSILAILRALDIPALDMSMPKVGHKMIYGYSEARDYDMYDALSHFSNYHLKGAPSRCLYILPKEGETCISATDKIRIKFTGEHTREAIEAGVSITHEDGAPVMCDIESHFRGNEWTFSPHGIIGGEEITVSVSEGLTDKRGTLAEAPRTIRYLTAPERQGAVSIEKIGNALLLRFPRPRRMRGERVGLRISTPRSCGRIGIYPPAGGKAIATSGSAMVGEYDIDITDYVSETRQRMISLLLRPMREAKERILLSYPMANADSTSPFTSVEERIYPPEEASSYRPAAPRGEVVPCSDGSGHACRFAAGESVYLHDIIPLRGECDLGRKYRISFEAMSPEGRSMHAKVICRDLLHEEPYMDFYSDSACLLELTPGEWKRGEFTFVPNNPDYLDKRHPKSTLVFLGTASVKIPSDSMFLRNLTVTELGGETALDDASVKAVIY